MVKAIVYTSNTGFTKKYADMLGKKINVPVYEFKKSKEKLNKNDEIVYMGWVMAGGIKNYEKSRKRYKIKAVCPVGMSAFSEKQNKEIIERHHIQEELFYLQGGYDKTKLKGIYKFMMNSLEKMIKKQLEKKEDKTAEEIEMLEMMNKGKDCVKEENLKDVIKWLKEND